MPYVKNVIAEIVEPRRRTNLRYGAPLNEEERMRWSSSSPAHRKIIPSSGKRAAFARLVGPARQGKSAAFGLRLRQVAKDTLSAADQNVLAKLAAQIKKAAKGG